MLLIGIRFQKTTNDQELIGMQINPWHHEEETAAFEVSFDSLLPINNLSIMDRSSWVEPVSLSIKLGINVLAQRHNTVMLVRLEPSVWTQALYH